MNAYEQKQAARKERYKELAEKSRADSNRLARKSYNMAEAIPFGQPVQVGHHSEHKDRRFRTKIGETMSKACRADEKADYYERKAESVGGGISSLDPDAIKKVRVELEKREALAEKMTAANRAIRSGDDKKLAELGFSSEDIKTLKTPDHVGRTGFAPFQLSNNRQNIARLKKRLATMEAIESRQEVEQDHGFYTYKEDKEENRILFMFNGKPSEPIRQVMKSNGFKWSPSRGAWTRVMTANGLGSARVAKSKLEYKFK